MRILQIFNRYAYMGGEEIAVEQITGDLSSRHDLRTITFDSHEWASETGCLSRIRQFLSMAWNPSSIRKVRDQVREFRPDVVVLHNTMPVGSAALHMYLAHCGVPVVQFIHNFRPFSVNGYCWGNGRLLPEGLERNYWPEILAGSWQNSRFKTAWYAFLIWSLHRMGVYQKIDGWIAISRFMKTAFVKGGIDESRISVISHGWQPQCDAKEAGKPSSGGDEPVFLFLGRLTEEKGLSVLLDAWVILEQSSNTGRLVIAGDGPLADEVKQRCGALKRATYVGFKTGKDKRRLLDECAALIVPSIWWEPLGLVLYEAYDHGKPVLAARSGGIVDHVEDGVTGWLHEPGDSAMLARQMLETVSDPVTCHARGMNGRNLLLERSTSVWIDEFNDFISSIIANSPNRGMQGGSLSMRAHANEEPDDNRSQALNASSRMQQSPLTAAPSGTCSGGVSPSLHTKADAKTATHEPATVIDRRYSSAVSPISNQESIIVSHQSSINPLLAAVADHGSQIVDGGSEKISEIGNPQSPISNPQSPISLSAYLADQNPGHDRSYGISRMSQAVLTALQARGRVEVAVTASRTSQQAPGNASSVRVLPWGTRRKFVRLLTDHFHPLFGSGGNRPDVYYFPKGYLPLLGCCCAPSVVTIHDTIIQYDEDHYPDWRNRFEYSYWAFLLRHTLRNADRILTVSETARSQIIRFMARHGIPEKEITVTYEPCLYEDEPQPDTFIKENYVIHLASCEPHKRTAQLIRWWHEAETRNRNLPTLQLIGTVPPEVEALLSTAQTIVKRPFLEEKALRAAYLHAKALILPSEIEGFGLPALEAYYLGTPVCFVGGTSVEEILGVATTKGAFSLDDPETLFSALDEVIRMEPEEVRSCGLKLRETYASAKVADRMIEVFGELKACSAVA